MIHAFRGLRYAPAAGNLAELVCPPYDKIDPAERERLKALSPYGAVYLVRGERSVDDTAWYAAARGRLDAWRRTGMLVEDGAPAFYRLQQRFVLPGGSLRTRTAVIGALDLAHRDRVHAHERTHERARQDRLLLLRATGAHLGQIFLLRRGERPLDAASLPVEDIAAVHGEPGVTSVFSAIREYGALQALERAFADASYVIADGHHRFATAVRYHEERPEASRVMVSVVDIDDPGLSVLPTHRVLWGIDPALVQSRIASLAGIEPAPPHEDLAAAVSARGPGTIGLLPAGGPALLWRAAKQDAADVEGLDVSRLERELLDPLLRGLEVEDHLGYLRDAAPAMARVRSGADALLCVLAPISPGLVADLALAGGVLPQKSTDFFPKLPTGLVFLPVTS
jgi:uncharacterized protein (DUF1015 family)